MANVLFYTFKSFPFKDVLPSNTFILGKLSSDIKDFQQTILKSQPELIIGVGAVRDFSRFERIAVNRFNNGSVSKYSKEQFDLAFPEKGFDSIRLSYEPTKSFCNWSAFKLAEFIQENNLNSKLSFVHINRKDRTKLLKLIDYLNNH